MDEKMQLIIRLPLLLSQERHYNIVCWRTEKPPVEWREIAVRLNMTEGALRVTWIRDIVTELRRLKDAFYQSSEDTQAKILELPPIPTDYNDPEVTKWRNFFDNRKN